MKLRVVEEADHEAVEGAAWYESRRPGLGQEFLEEVRRVFALIEEHSQRFAQLETTRHPIRRILLQRFPYLVPYEIFETEIVIWAVAHGSRRPGYWESRGQGVSNE